MSDLIENRVLGNIPVSIDTSLAFQGLFGTHEETTNEQKTKDYTGIYLNVRTIIRNLLFAAKIGNPIINQEFIDKYASEIVVSAMYELDVIVKELYQHKANQILLYLGKYAGLQQRFPHAKLRVESRNDRFIPKDAFGHLIERISIQIKQELLKTKSKDEQIIIFDGDITANMKSVLLFTHNPLDLFVHKVNIVDLLESHTGKIKTSSTQYTKYYNGNELPPLPFHRWLLQIFGDKEFFSPQPMKLRKAVLETARKYGWNSQTIEDRLRLTIMLVKDPAMKSALSAFTKS